MSAFDDKLAALRALQSDTTDPIAAKLAALRNSPAEQARQRLAARGLTPEMVKGGVTSAPGELRPATGPERFFETGIHALAAIPTALAARATVPIDAAIHYGQMLQKSPDELAQDFGNLDFGKWVPSMPVTKAVADASLATTKAVAPTVPPNAITDTSAAVGDIAGTLAANKAAETAGVVSKAAGNLAADATTGARTAIADQAPNLVNSMVNAPIKYFKFGANPGKALVGMKTSAFGGVESMLPELESKIAATSGTLDRVLSTPAAQTKAIPIQDIIESEINAAKEKAARTGNDALVTRLEKLRDGQLAQFNGAKIVDPQTAQRYKVALGEDVKFSEDAIEGSVNDTMQNIYRGVDKAIDAAVPATKSLNADLANQITAKKVLQNAQRLGLKSTVADKLHPKSLVELLNPATYIDTPFVRSRVAAGLNALDPREAAALPETVADRVYQAPVQRLALSGRPVTRALPPAPEGAMAGFVSSDNMRRVGTSLGPTEGQDAAVFAQRSATQGMQPDNLMFPFEQYLRELQNRR